ncbi:MAG: hypothetical protein UT66_C0005G0015 [candidate division CPR2 bacterium GW2011_GWC1_39_9]|uniref:Uncharacterized protein n=1 Tax=candidate division CPR2 bacterium GW2011_GWC2_39_10 TaxID=1618345 RepID=A0A0G0Q0B1_UNCC2|nr:MAG: hypothetical protein UT18_C0004G0038 [candidate division CPR2 bacterium GW2011_GWC2_39_10]KKR35979.1 MAG: hypothetical protein UT66_C0005G0015 [candidate division CPR2 bacterium GW2011_GWC1_39_9]
MIYLATTILASFGCFVLGLAVLLKDKKNPLNILFFIFTMMLIFYNIANYFWYNPQISSFLFRLTYSAGSLTVASGTSWAISISKGYNKRNILIIYFIGIIFALLAIPNGLLIKQMSDQLPTANFQNSMTPLYYVYIAYAIATVFYAIFAITKATIKQKGLVKKKMSLIVAGITLFAISALTVDLLLPNLGINVSYLNNVSSLVFIGLSSLAMIKYSPGDSNG